MDAHSIYGPSSATKWLNCPGSIKAEEGIPDTTSEFAAEGTCAHALAELCLTTELNHVKRLVGKHQIINKERQDQPITSEMADYVQEYVDYVREIGGHQEYEQHFDYSDWVPGGFGTGDAVAVNGTTLHSIDLKYGKGIPVFAEENPQGMLYALGALSERDAFQTFDKVVIVIHQPRLNSVSEWETTPEHIYEFAAKAREAYKATLKGDAPRIPGEKQCQWCKAKATCPALQSQTEHALMTQFEDLTVKPLKAPTELTDQDLSFILQHKVMIEKWLKSVEQHVVGRFESGQQFPGFKMVEGRSNRKWADDAEAEKLLIKLLGKDNAYKKKLITAPAAEKALGKEKKAAIYHLVIKPAGKPVLVNIEDKRPPMTLGITAADFD
jgi:hypothetical protein